MSGDFYSIARLKGMNNIKTELYLNPLETVLKVNELFAMCLTWMKLVVSS